MAKRILSFFLIVVLAIAFAVPALAFSPPQNNEKGDEEIMNTGGMFVSVQRTYGVSQTVPGSITHSETRPDGIYIGTLFRVHVGQKGNVVTATFNGYIFPAS